MIPDDSKIMGIDDSIIDELYKTFMKDNMPPKVIENMKDSHEYIFKGIFMAGAQAFSAIIDGMEKAGLPDRVGAQTYGNMVKAAEHQMLGRPFSIAMSAMRMPTSDEVH